MVLMRRWALDWSGAHFILSRSFLCLMVDRSPQFSVVELTIVVVTVDLTLLLCLDLFLLLVLNLSCLDGLREPVLLVVVSLITVKTER